MNQNNKSVLNQFQGSEGQSLLIDALRSQALIGDRNLALEFARHTSLEAIPQGTILIRQGDSGNDLFLVLTGEFSIVVDGEIVERRAAGQHLGEMALVDPEALRSASVIAACDSVVGRISEPAFSKLAERFPLLWRRIASGLAAHMRRTEPASAARLHRAVN